MRLGSHRPHNAILAIALWGLFWVACVSAPASPTPPARLYPLPQLNSPEYGIQAFLWWHVDNKTAWRDADLVRDLGFGWIKQQVSWREMIHARPQSAADYDFFRTDAIVQIAEERGLKLLLRLDQQPQWSQADPTVWVPNGPPGQMQDFGDFCGVLGARYRGRVAAYEVWNEPNLTREWGDQLADPAAYVELLKACYLALKQADPQVIVISAGLSPTGPSDPTIAMPDDEFYRGLYAAGGAPYFDMLGVHAPGYSHPPERSPEETEQDAFWQGRWWVFRHVEDIRAIMVANGDGDKQIAITEMGWTSDQRPDSSYAWHAVTETQKAEYLVRAYQYARDHWQPWIGLMSMIYIADPSWTEADEQYWWAITRPTAAGEPALLLPAYEALREMEK